MDNMYTPEQLSQVYGSADPQTYIQGQQQASLAQQNYEQQTQALSLQNQFNAQDNQTKLQQSQANLTTTQNANTISGVQANIATNTSGLQLDAAKQKFLLDASESDVKLAMAKGQQMAQSLDPAVSAQGQRIMLLSQAAIEAKQKHAYDMETHAADNATSIQHAQIMAGGTVDAARLNNVGRVDVATIRSGINKTIEQRLMTAKTDEDKQGIYEQGARAAAAQGDFAGAQDLAQMGQHIGQRRSDLKQAGVLAGQAGKIDNSQLNLPVQTYAQPLSLSQPLPGVGQQQQQSAPPASMPPPEAIQKLKAHPELAALFEGKYNLPPGSAKQYLGQ